MFQASEFTLQGSTQICYRQINGVALYLHIFKPVAQAQMEAHYPAVLFFFGGGWQNGTPNQFEHQCRYLSERGMVAVAVEYRVESRHGVTPYQCVEDATESLNYLVEHSDELKIDTQKIVVSGGSAGGHLAANLCFHPKTEKHVAAAVLFNPVINTAIESWPKELLAHSNFAKNVVSKLGDQGKAISPLHQVRQGFPPTIIFHGADDTTVPCQQVRDYAQVMTQVGNRCDLKVYDGYLHGFFNLGLNGNIPFKETLEQTDRFLVSLGILVGESSVDAYLQKKGITIASA